MNKKTIGLALTISGLTMTSVAQASLAIDDFSNDTSLLFPSAGSTDSEITSPLSGSDFSNSRLLEITDTSFSGVFPTVTTQVTNGFLSVRNHFQGRSETTVSYNNSAGFDFTVAELGGSLFNAFVLNLSTTDFAGVTVALTVDGVFSLKTVNTVGDIVFEHSLFNDVSSINNIELLFLNDDSDVIFDSFQSFGAAPPPIPVPAAVWLFGTGVIGLFGFSRNRAKETA